MDIPVNSRATTEDQIVEAVVDALRPWKPQHRQIETGRRAGEIVAKADAEVLAHISDAVRSEIVRFRTLVPDFFDRDAIRKTRDDARDIIKSVDRLKEHLLAKTFSPELRMRLDVRRSRLLDALNEARDICQAADENQPQADQVKLWCAQIAIRLMLDFSLSRPAAGSGNTEYCRIASLLYESVTGDRDENLRHICQDVLRPYQSLLP